MCARIILRFSFNILKVSAELTLPFVSPGSSAMEDCLLDGRYFQEYHYLSSYNDLVLLASCSSLALLSIQTRRQTHKHADRTHTEDGLPPFLPKAGLPNTRTDLKLCLANQGVKP